MIELRPNECRVLGVLVEKAHTTPQQYPLTLNALINGCNQKNNRFPVSNLSEDDVLEAIDGLRAKQLVREAMLSGSRVAKYKHNAREAMGVETRELVILAELMLRGPQTLGEIRGRASRMHDLGSIEQVRAIVGALMERDEPMVREIPPEPGSRANRFMQLLCLNLHRIETGGRQVETSETRGAEIAGKRDEQPAVSNGALEERVAKLESEVAELREMLEQLLA